MEIKYKKVGNSLHIDVNDNRWYNRDDLLDMFIFNNNKEDPYCLKLSEEIPFVLSYIYPSSSEIQGIRCIYEKEDPKYYSLFDGEFVELILDIESRIKYYFYNKENKVWHKLRRILYEVPIEELPLYIGSPKKYKEVIAGWILKNAKT